jgi:hypothetical protein
MAWTPPIFDPPNPWAGSTAVSVPEDGLETKRDLTILEERLNGV